MASKYPVLKPAKMVENKTAGGLLLPSRARAIRWRADAMPPGMPPHPAASLSLCPQPRMDAVADEIGQFAHGLQTPWNPRHSKARFDAPRKGCVAHPFCIETALIMYNLAFEVYHEPPPDYAPGRTLSAALKAAAHAAPRMEQSGYQTRLQYLYNCVHSEPFGKILYQRMPRDLERRCTGKVPPNPDPDAEGPAMKYQVLGGLVGSRHATSVRHGNWFSVGTGPVPKATQ